MIDHFELTGTSAEVTDPEILSSQADLVWIPAAVPGGVHESLFSAGMIGHPYFGRNDRTLAWVDDLTWWYRSRFDGPSTAPGARVQLILHGVDTVATVWLNGDRLGYHQTQFRPAEFDVTELIDDHNELLVRFDPPLAGLEVPPSVAEAAKRVGEVMAVAMPADKDSHEEPGLGIGSSNLALTLRRKATFSWGWDFAPRLPSVGLYRPVELRVERAAVITGHHLRTTAVDGEAGTARVGIDVEVDADHDGPLSVRIRLTPPGGTSTVLTANLDQQGRLSTEVALDGAQLWWTHDLGEPVLYDVLIEVLDSDKTVLTHVDDRIGVRIIELDRSDDTDEGGRLFRFVLNGVPLFIRGANWVPADMMVGSVAAATCRFLVEQARAGNMTMLRVWGGGLYEQDAFYDACDDNGILIWQDFMFACTDYPSDDPELRPEVEAEARYQVRRLRNHPAVAVWAGNNEVHAIHQAVYGNLDPGNWGYTFFHEILPAAVKTHSPGAIYWPGCPWADSDDRVNGVLDGDRHAWEVWHGVDVGAGGPKEFPSHGAAVHFSRYQYDRGKFISEFGIQSAPEVGTLQRWTPPGSLVLHGAELNNRNKDAPKNKADAIMEVETGLPTSVEQFVDHMMICQAEGLKFGIEHYRRRQPHCSGTLIWQLNDAWPGLSWSMIDHDLIAKAGYYYAQRAYRPVLTSFVHTGDRIELWVTNSGIASVTAQLDVEIATYAGATVLGESVSVTAGAGSSTALWSCPADDTMSGGDRYAWVSDRTGNAEANRLFFGPVKEQRFGQASLEHHVVDHGGGLADIHVTSHGFNYLTRVPAPAAGISFDRNYFDLRDGQSVVVRAQGIPSDVGASTLNVASYNTMFGSKS